MDFSFYKVVPGGNATIILTDEKCRENLADYSAKLMHPMHLQAEQVGLLSLNNDKTILPSLQMMGGEFCINATRAAALIMAHKGFLEYLGENVLHGFLRVSGAAAPLHVLAGANLQDVREQAQACLLSAVPKITTEGLINKASRMFCAARISCEAQAILCQEIQPGAVLVKMPGIAHLLLDKNIHPYEDSWQGLAAKWRKISGLENEPASGVVWYEYKNDAYSILPVVYVAQTHSEHMETACGSASFAIAFVHCTRLSRKAAHALGPQNINLVRVLQKSGEYLEVLFMEQEGVVNAYVNGEARLVAEGRAYI